jgi:hypothetical protein
VDSIITVQSEERRRVSEVGWRCFAHQEALNNVKKHAGRPVVIKVEFATGAREMAVRQQRVCCRLLSGAAASATWG